MICVVYRNTYVLHSENSSLYSEVYSNDCRGVDVENAIKLAAADDGFVTYDELRENLRKLV